MILSKLLLGSGSPRWGRGQKLAGFFFVEENDEEGRGGGINIYRAPRHRDLALPSLLLLVLPLPSFLSKKNLATILHAVGIQILLLYACARGSLHTAPSNWAKKESRNGSGGADPLKLNVRKIDRPVCPHA